MLSDFDGSYIGIESGAKQGHFHTISLKGVYSHDKRYPYQLWDALKKFSVLSDARRAGLLSGQIEVDGE